ncbi:MAG: BatD family protein, partial [Anaerolineae bacterium]
MRQLKYAFCLITVIAFSLVAAPARAQSPLTAEVDRAGLSTDESVTLTVVVTGSALNPPQPSLPPLDGFEVIGSSSSSQISIVNGNVTAQGVYRYRLRPLQTGELVIGPVSATINGQSYTTDPIAVQVTPGNAPATPPEQAPPAP